MFLIIHNPLSSNKKSRKKTKKIVRFFKKKNVPFIVRSSLKIDSINAFLDERTYITDILLLGGDGSINYFINSVDLKKIKQNIYLAKSGSGNDFLRSLKPLGSAKVNIGQALLDHKKPIKFINGCGLGFDGLVCHYVNNDNKKNKISYFINVFRSIINYTQQDIKLIVDGVEHHFKKSYIAAIQNGRYFGGGMKAAPKADITNDSFKIIIAHNLNRFLLQALLLTIYPGWHRFIKKRITILEGKNIQVELQENVYFQADGEVHESVKTIDVKSIEKRVLHTFTKASLKKI